MVPNGEEMQEQVVAPIVQVAEELAPVVNVEQHTAALKLLVNVMAAENRVKDAFREPKKKAHEAHKAITALEKSLLDPIQEARKTISGKCTAFEEEERRAAQKIQEALRAEAEARQQQQRELDAAMSDTPEEAEDALTRPLAPPPVAAVAPLVGKVAGLSTRQTWTAEVTDMAAFVRWCVSSGSLYMLAVNEVMLNTRARAEQDHLNIPGVRAVRKLSHARR